MLISYYEDGTSAPRRMSALLTVLMIANVLFSATILFAWTYVSYFVAEPLSWALWLPVSRGAGFAGVLDYPFILMWMMPLIGAFGGWVGYKGSSRPVAYAFVGIPLVILVLVVGWFYLAPSEWH